MKKFLPAVILLVLFSGILLIKLRRNTGFLTLSPPKEEIIRNNLGDSKKPEGGAGNEGLSLSAEVLKVPPKYQSGVFSVERKLNLPKGFEISLYAAGLGKARHFDFDEADNLYVTDLNGRLYLVREAGEVITTIESGLRNPHGIDFYKEDLYVAEEHQVVVFREIAGDGNFSKKEVLIGNLPSGRGHFTRTLKIGPDEKIYLSIGSSCNVCEEKDERRAAIVRYNLDGTAEEIFARGLRNTVGFTFDEGGGIWGVDNGRDLVGDNLPPEEINLIEQGKHYGWPYCYGNGIPNPEFPEKKGFCETQTKYPLIQLPAHTAPLGLAFLRDNDKNFPASFASNLFVALHGSWNSTVPVGYKVVMLGGKGQNADFVTGWLEENGQAWGRPVNVDFNKGGELFISDDKAGAIYKVAYQETD